MKQSLKPDVFADYLFELGTEELPPASLETLAQHFKDQLIIQLAHHHITFDTIRYFATPRRLAVLINKITLLQADQTIEKRGPALQAAFKPDGSPTPAAQGFAKSCQTSVAALDRLTTEKGSWLLYRSVKPGQTTANLLPEIITNCLNKLPIPKKMRWHHELDSFIRPVHWMVSLLDTEPVPITRWGITSSRATYGHRVHSPCALPIPKACDYETLLETEGFVIADLNKRRQKIAHDIKKYASQEKAIALLPSELLTEITALVEWPVLLVGKFDSKFLTLPQEVLITTMQSHQKYIALLDQAEENETSTPSLKTHFFIIANLDSQKPTAVIQGNEKVITPRFSDAQFFYMQDQKQPLEAFNQSLETILFQKKLGSLWDKVQRITHIALYLSPKFTADAIITQRAATLCKADLATEMVQELPELQGLMGRYYAQLSGENASVATAIEEHYYPLNMYSVIPNSPEACCVAVADKLDTLIGIFSTGQTPTGDKDPFALRRAATGIIKILVESKQSLDLKAIIEKAKTYFSFDIPNIVTQQIIEFLYARFPAFYPDFCTEQINAILSLDILDPYDIDLRLKAIDQIQKNQSEIFATLIATDKRVNNLLKKIDTTTLGPVDSAILTEPAEQTLDQHINSLHPYIISLCAEKDYDTALTQLGTLKQPIDVFFDQVHIMAEKSIVRQQRLNLVYQLRQLLLSVADLSKLPSP